MAVTITFKRFLKMGLDRKSFGDTPEGDFARDAAADSSFRDFDDWDSLRTFLVFHKACPEAVNAARKLFKIWKAGK